MCCHINFVGFSRKTGSAVSWVSVERIIRYYNDDVSAAVVAVSCTSLVNLENSTGCAA